MYPALLLIPVLFGPFDLNWNGPEVYVLKGSSKTHRFSVRFKQANFTAGKQKLTWVWDETRVCAMPGFIDRGMKRQYYGFDAYPKDEVATTSLSGLLKERATRLVSLELMVDGKSWPVPRPLYDDLLCPDLGPSYVRGSISPDGKTVRVRMVGSDAAGGYEADWTFRKDGKHMRKIIDEC